jgi:anaphase-promoting complex subunit 1
MSLVTRLHASRKEAFSIDRIEFNSSLFGYKSSMAFGRMEVFNPLRRVNAVYKALADGSTPDTRKRAERAIQILLSNGPGAEMPEVFPLGVAAPLREAARTCQFAPPGNWPAEAYTLIGRNDLAEGASAPPDRLFNDGYRPIKDHLVSEMSFRKTFP